MTNHRPAAPLPWITNKRVDVISADRLMTVSKGPAKQSTDAANAAYIAHAANAYPELVKALRAIVRNGDNYGTPEPWDIATAALREVGEAQS